MWTSAITVDVCKECGADIEPGARVLRTLVAEAANPLTKVAHAQRATFCLDCGKLYEESQDLGGDEY